MLDYAIRRREQTLLPYGVACRKHYEAEGKSIGSFAAWRQPGLDRAYRGLNRCDGGGDRREVIGLSRTQPCTAARVCCWSWMSVLSWSEIVAM